jgi:hypothetical protein
MSVISQMLSVSYEAVLNAKRKPENQWAENAFLRELERVGAIKTIAGSHTIEFTLDYKRNDGGEFQSTDLQPVSTTKTEVVTSAQYEPAQLVVPITWSRADETKNSSENAKVNLVDSLVDNALTTHDELVEEALFTTSTQGMLGLLSLVPEGGQGTIGGIDSGVEAWWRSFSTTYASNFSDIESVMITAYNAAAKGSGSALAPKFLISGSEPHAGYEASQQANIRYVDTKEADAGFKILAFKTARYSFSQFGDDHIWFLNPKNFQVQMFKGAVRDLGGELEFTNANGYIRKVFTMLQAVTNNRSRLAVIYAGA